ncbi:MAG TPA: sulfite exporter TauE/SafE family protein [Chromatiales bacterium]|nr:sulfite exporter TauE/SafE family protein [Chromatiales bacterium]
MDILLSSISLTDLAAYLSVGAFAGILAGMLGIGGGLVIVPVLLGVFRLQGVSPDIAPHLAVGTSLATIVFTSLSSIRAHHRRGAVRWGVVKALAPGIVLGALAGAVIAGVISGPWLQRLFAIFVMVVGVRMLRGTHTAARRDLPATGGMLAAGGLIGAVSSLVGIGGGTLTVPFLSACRVGMREAVATSSACGLPIAVAGSIGFIAVGWADPRLPPGALGFLHLPAALLVVAASVPFAPVGVWLAHRMPVVALSRVFAGMLLLVGVKLLLGSA